MEKLIEIIWHQRNFMKKYIIVVTPVPADDVVKSRYAGHLQAQHCGNVALTNRRSEYDNDVDMASRITGKSTVCSVVYFG